jgi:hypothetical protein
MNSAHRAAAAVDAMRQARPSDHAIEADSALGREAAAPSPNIV